MKKASSVKNHRRESSCRCVCCSIFPDEQVFCASRIGCGIGRACLSVVRRIYEWVFKQFLHT